MSWDSKALAILVLIWAALSVIYITAIGMMTGARAWGTGAFIFFVLLLGVLYVERRSVRRN